MCVCVCVCVCMGVCVGADTCRSIIACVSVPKNTTGCAVWPTRPCLRGKLFDDVLRQWKKCQKHSHAEMVMTKGSNNATCTG